MTPGQPAILDPTTRTVVNGHFFWVSSPENLAEFRANPQRYTGPLLDPVTHEWFVPDDNSPRHDTRGGIFLFSSFETARSFEVGQDPHQFHWHY